MKEIDADIVATIVGGITSEEVNNRVIQGLFELLHNTQKYLGD